jgi:hypothetical protein
VSARLCLLLRCLVQLLPSFLWQAFSMSRCPLVLNVRLLCLGCNLAAAVFHVDTKQHFTGRRTAIACLQLSWAALR